MTIITLTSDFGVQDHYVAKLKGTLLSYHAALNIVDITHNIKNYDIVQSAYAVRHTYSSFPKGSIHLVSVNNFYASHCQYLAIRYDGHYFIGPDNGVFSLIFGHQPSDIYTITSDFSENLLLNLSHIYAKAVAHIIENEAFETIGTTTPQLIERISLQPIIGPTQIRGSVIHVDNYENVILNINRELWGRYAYYRHFALFFKRHEPITQLSSSYNEVAIGETLCLFNTADHLEIAINLGKASSLLGLSIDDTVQLDFY
jgi:S-adenosyl-L-methionine hydrolase (adenosine-forming)